MGKFYLKFLIKFFSSHFTNKFLNFFSLSLLPLKGGKIEPAYKGILFTKRQRHEDALSCLQTSRVKGTNMGSGLFSVNKKHYLPETIRNIQTEQKKTSGVDSMTTVSFEEELSLFFKNVKYRINIPGILVTKT